MQNRFTKVPHIETATIIRYVFQASITYEPPDPIIAAADRNWAAKNASVVTSVSQPKMLIHPTRKLTMFRHRSVDSEYVKWYCPPAVGQIDAISPNEAPMHRLHSTQRMKP